MKDKRIMSTNVVGANPAVLQDGTTVPVQSTELAQTEQSSGSIITTGGLEVPEFMLSIPKTDLGTELMKQYVSPPRLKIVGKSSADELQQEFGISAVVCNGKMVTPPIDFKNKQETSNPIRVLPVFFYPEFVFQNPMGIAPFIKERSLDPNSKLALRCRGQFEKRFVKCPEDEKLTCKYVEYLNFIVFILDPLGFDEPIIINFRGSSHTEGRNWCKAAAKPKYVPLFAQIFELNCSIRKKDPYSWYAWNVRNAVDHETNMIEILRDEATVRAYYDWHLECKSNYEDGLIVAQYESEDDNEESSGTPVSAAVF